MPSHGSVIAILRYDSNRWPCEKDRSAGSIVCRGIDYILAVAGQHGIKVRLFPSVAEHHVQHSPYRLTLSSKLRPSAGSGVLIHCIWHC